jgi:hypothetical protein
MVSVGEEFEQRWTELWVGHQLFVSHWFVFVKVDVRTFAVLFAEFNCESFAKLSHK